MAESIKGLAAIREYMEAPNASFPGGCRKVDLTELKGLSASDREELSRLCAEGLGKKLEK